MPELGAACPPWAEHRPSFPLPRRRHDQGAEKCSEEVASAVSRSRGVPCNGNPPPRSTSSGDSGGDGGATEAAAAGISGGASPATGQDEAGGSQSQRRAGAQAISSNVGRIVCACASGAHRSLHLWNIYIAALLPAWPSCNPVKSRSYVPTLHGGASQHVANQRNIAWRISPATSRQRVFVRQILRSQLGVCASATGCQTGRPGSTHACKR